MWINGIYRHLLTKALYYEALKSIVLIPFFTFVNLGQWYSTCGTTYGSLCEMRRPFPLGYLMFYALKYIITIITISNPPSIFVTTFQYIPNLMILMTQGGLHKLVPKFETYLQPAVANIFSLEKPIPCIIGCWNPFFWWKIGVETWKKD